MYLAGYMVSGFLLAGVYAFARLRGRWGRYERAGLAIPLTIAALASIAQAPIGDWAARDVATNQPIKLAAMEGLTKTTRGAPEHLLGYYTNGRLKFAIEIPHGLSLLAFHSWNATVKGLDTVPPSQRPPVNVVHIDFQIMVGIGTPAGAAQPVHARRATAAAKAARFALVLPIAAARRPARDRRPDHRLDRHRGRPPALGRLPRDADLGRGHRARPGSPSATAR